MVIMIAKLINTSSHIYSVFVVTAPAEISQHISNIEYNINCSHHAYKLDV